MSLIEEYYLLSWTNDFEGKSQVEETRNEEARVAGLMAQAIAMPRLFRIGKINYHGLSLMCSGMREIPT